MGAVKRAMHWNDEVMEIERNKVTEAEAHHNVGFRLVRDFYEYFAASAREQARMGRPFQEENKRFNVGEVVYIPVAKKYGVVQGRTGFEYLTLVVDGYEHPQSIRAVHVNKFREGEC
jgi:hypothetical protein